MMLTYETTGYLLAGLVVLLAVGFGGVTYFYLSNQRREREYKRQAYREYALHLLMNDVERRNKAAVDYRREEGRL